METSNIRLNNVVQPCNRKRGGGGREKNFNASIGQSRDFRVGAPQLIFSFYAINDNKND